MCSERKEMGRGGRERERERESKGRRMGERLMDVGLGEEL